MVEVGVAGGYHQLVVGMLKFRQSFRDAVIVMVVDESDSADHDGIGYCCLLANKTITNKVTERFGSVGITESRSQIIEAFEEIGIEGDSDSAENPQWSLLAGVGILTVKLENSTITIFVALPTNSICWGSRI